MLTPSDLKARKERLAQLALDFIYEVLEVRDNPGRLLQSEGREYLTALHNVVAGLEMARVVLVEALERMERNTSL